MTGTQASLPPTDLPRATLGVLIIVVLIALTIWILRPFLGAIIWASMIVVATWPVMRQLQAWLWGSRKLAVAAMIVALLLVLVLPLSLAIGTIVSNASEIVDWAARLRSLAMPAPPAWLGTLPIVGTQAVEAWQTLAASRLADVAAAATPYAATAILWMASTMKGVGWLLVQFLLTLAITAIMYAKGERVADGLLRFGRHLAGESGARAAVAWLYWQGAAGAATGLLLWTLVVVTLDNVLRPVLMTKGADLPMLLMFAGVMGGLLAFGLIGIFVGPVVLAVSYTLLGAWIDTPQSSE